jgi:hypothetical protein
MKKLIAGLMLTGLLAGNVMAEERYVGEITYVQIKGDGSFAIKVLPTGATDPVYAVTNPNNPEKAKAIYAMALTALVSGKQIEAWKEGPYWTNTFLRK